MFNSEKGMKRTVLQVGILDLNLLIGSSVFTLCWQLYFAIYRVVIFSEFQIIIKIKI